MLLATILGSRTLLSEIVITENVVFECTTKRADRFRCLVDETLFEVGIPLCATRDSSIYRAKLRGREIDADDGRVARCAKKCSAFIHNPLYFCSSS